jgi:FixJ family two-component response regulator
MLLTAGVSHKTAPLAVRERQDSELVAVARSLKPHFDLDELVLLSSCNRVEIYGTTRRAITDGKSLSRLAILDMRMPEMDGLELLESMRERNIQTPVVIITAYGDVPHAVRAMKLGAIDFLQKPLTPEALRSAVGEILGRHAKPASHPAREETFDTHVQAAKQLINLREFPAAREHIAKALEIRSDSPEVFNLGGVLFEMLEDYKRAKRYYGQAIRLNKNYEPAQQNMRRIYELFQFGSSKEPFNLGED